MNLTTHEERLLDEHRELTERYNKLKAFLQTPGFTVLKEAEATRLRCQSIFMEGYVKVLTERIHAMIRVSAPAQDDSGKIENILQAINNE